MIKKDKVPDWLHYTLKGDFLYSYIKGEPVRIFKYFHNDLKSYIIKSLKKDGYLFNNDKELNSFLSKRVTKVIFGIKSNEDHIYIDLGTKEQKRLCIYRY